MTGISDIFNPRPKPASVKQAVPREYRKVRVSLLDALFGKSAQLLNHRRRNTLW
jgi:hypothetical protein